MISEWEWILNQCESPTIPELEFRPGMISVRYMLSEMDFERGSPQLIAEGLGYGLGQITSESGLRMVPSRSMLRPDAASISRVIGSGTVADGLRYIDVAIDGELLDLQSLGFAGLLTLIAGDVFGAPYTADGLTLMDLHLPSDTIEGFEGPEFGAAGVLDRLNCEGESAVTALLLKPDMGVPVKHYADLADAAAQAGIQYIKEDELSLDSRSARRAERVAGIAERLRR